MDLPAVPVSPAFPGGIEMYPLIQRYDWSRTPLGPMDGWPQNLKAAVQIILASRYPMFVWWGRELIDIHNDAYIPALGQRHPAALGRPAREIWREIWGSVGPLTDAVFEGRATWSERLLLPLERNLYREETYFTFSYSPVFDETGKVAGLFCACLDETGPVLAERRMRTLRELGLAAEAKTAEQACERAVQVVSGNPHDVPFSLLYLLDGNGPPHLAGSSGLAPAAPEAARMAKESRSWPIAEVVASGRAVVAHDLGKRIGPLPGGPWPDPADTAIALPVAHSSGARPEGVLVAGISPWRPLDDDYRGFLDLAANQIASAVFHARSYEAERRRAEALAELDRAKTLFMSNVSHEFRTPLTLLLGPLEEILRNGADDALSVGREELELVHRNGLRLLKLVNTLLDFSRVEAGRLRTVLEPIPLAELTAEVASVFRSAIERAGLRLIVDCPPLSEPVAADREMWEKIVLNLVSNAFKFTGKGEIEVSLRQIGDRAELRVRDTGAGIAERELPHIFERFYRVEGAQGRTSEGSGIGLALVQELVKAQEGSVRVESKAGKGSTFIVSIPLRRTVEREASAAGGASGRVSEAFVEEAKRWIPEEAEAGPGTFAERILLVDDNADMRGYVRRLLAERYEVEAVGDGEAALAAARERPPHLVLADVMMPRLDGFALLRELRADRRTGAIPVILLSARAGEEARVQGLASGADDYLVKPFTARELMVRVDTHLKMARVRRSWDAERQKAAESLAEWKGRYEAAMRASGQVIYDWNPALDDTTWGGELERILGYQSSELEGGLEGWIQLVHPEDRARLREEIASCMRTGAAAFWEYRVRRKDGQYIHVEDRADFLRDGEGRPVRLIGFLVDVTERRRFAEQLREKQRLESLGVLAGGIAHDFNNLLVGILGNASLMLDDLPASDPNRPLVKEVVLASERAADLTRQMLAYSGQGGALSRNIDLSGLVREIGTLLQSSIPKKVQLHLNLGEDLPSMTGDPGQIQQVVMNLILNGAEAIGDDHSGMVEVTTSVCRWGGGEIPARPVPVEMSAGDYICLEVRDNGSGMDEATSARIFDPFFTTKFTGRGLGLSAVLGIVHRQKGALQVESSPGQGSHFRVLFPLAGARQEPPAPPGLQIDLRGSGLVLVIDDERLVREIARNTLTRYGYQVLLAENGSAGVEMFLENAQSISLVILDLAMPLMSGAEALDHIKDIRGSVPVILSSGFGESEARRRFQGKGLAGFLQKPYSSAWLARTVKAVLSQASMTGRPG